MRHTPFRHALPPPPTSEFYSNSIEIKAQKNKRKEISAKIFPKHVKIHRQPFCYIRICIDLSTSFLSNHSYIYVRTIHEYPTYPPPHSNHVFVDSYIPYHPYHTRTDSKDPRAEEFSQFQNRRRQINLKTIGFAGNSANEFQIGGDGKLEEGYFIRGFVCMGRGREGLYIVEGWRARFRSSCPG